MLSTVLYPDPSPLVNREGSVAVVGDNTGRPTICVLPYMHTDGTGEFLTNQIRDCFVSNQSLQFSFGKRRRIWVQECVEHYFLVYTEL